MGRKQAVSYLIQKQYGSGYTQKVYCVVCLIRRTPRSPILRSLFGTPVISIIAIPAFRADNFVQADFPSLPGSIRCRVRRFSNRSH